MSSELCSAPTAKRVYVIDDDNTFRVSMAVLLRTAGWDTSEFVSIGEFLDRSANLAPGVLIIDVRMPGGGALELLETHGETLRPFAVVVVTGHGDVDTAVRCLKAGAVDFIEKPFSGEDLVQSLDARYSELIQQVTHTQREEAARAKVALLSPRERDVLCGLMVGESYKATARNLGLSARTVEMYRNNLARKLGVRSTGEAVHVGVLARLTSTTGQS